ncbi:hypothetical protein [Massilia sp. DD77]|uniref:hypothetical protein n=1 Tax=Massilia sp. DD77 TaxID=3109349 RepID=UPI002FFFC50C
MRAMILTAASAFCLLGCMTPQEKALKQQAEMDRMMAEFGPACVQLGYAANSDPWRNCVLQLAAKDGKYEGVSTSIFGSWGRWGGSGVGIGIGIGR